MKSNIDNCFEYLEKAGDYALIGANAVKILLKKKRWATELKEPLEVICINGVQHNGLNLITQEHLKQSGLLAEGIIKESSIIEYNGHSVKIARPEHLIVLNMEFGNDYGADSYLLIHYLNGKINFEMIRNLLKPSSRYEDNYNKLVGANYELV